MLLTIPGEEKLWSGRRRGLVIVDGWHIWSYCSSSTLPPALFKSMATRIAVEAIYEGLYDRKVDLCIMWRRSFLEE